MIIEVFFGLFVSAAIAHIIGKLDKLDYRLDQLEMKMATRRGRYSGQEESDRDQ